MSTTCSCIHQQVGASFVDPVDLALARSSLSRGTFRPPACPLDRLDRLGRSTGWTLGTHGRNRCAGSTILANCPSDEDISFQCDCSRLLRRVAAGLVFPRATAGDRAPDALSARIGQTSRRVRHASEGAPPQQGCPCGSACAADRRSARSVGRHHRLRQQKRGRLEMFNGSVISSRDPVDE